MSLLSRLRGRNSTTAPSGIAAPPGAPTTEQKAALDQATEHFKAGNLKMAEAALAGMVDPLHAQAHDLLSLIAMQKGDLVSALGRAQEAIRLAPSNADFHFHLARVYASQRGLAEAIREYQEAVRLRPDVTEWRLELAAALVRAGRLVDAVAAHETGTPRPPDARAYFDLGHALLQSRQPSEAEQALRQAAVMAPESGGIHFYLAIACREQDRPLDAEAGCPQSDRRCPRHASRMVRPRQRADEAGEACGGCGAFSRGDLVAA